MRPVCARLFRQFSFPGGIGSHVTPETPGSIHEGGELGYALVHAFGAAFDNPDLVVFCVVGDGEAETGPLAASWHSNKFLNPAVDGTVIPILALNGYKIASPTVLDRIPEAELISLFEGYGYAPYIVAGDDPDFVHRAMAEVLDSALDDIDAIQARRPQRADRPTPRWPMIILRTPKGWTGPEGGRRPADRGDLALAPGPAVDRPRRTRITSPSSRRGCGQLSARRAVRRRRRAAAGARSTSPPRRRTPHEREPARQRRPAAARPAAPRLPRVRRGRRAPGQREQRGDPGPRGVPARRHRGATRRRSGCSGRTRPTSNRLDAVFEVDRPGLDGRDPARPTSTSRRTAGSWRCSPSTSARAGWRGTC